MRRCVHSSPPGRELTPTPTRASAGAGRASSAWARSWPKTRSARFGLNAFKLLGARFAIETLIAEGAIRPGARWCARAKAITAAPSRAPRATPAARRASTWPHDAAAARADGIAGEGAEVDSRRRLLRRCGAHPAGARPRTHGWTIVSDTAWQGYERIPRLIMLGYTRMIDEV